ncbi:MAG TPA: hypothetical protein VHF69_07885 [Candidatus Synoicihabitans sp.]|nr:hypothetical protein [Candidatus Synoicihabitans sp.]
MTTAARETPGGVTRSGARRRRLRQRGARGGIKLKLLMALAVAAATGALVWMMFLPQIVAARLAQRSGFGVVIDRFVANPFTGRAELVGLAIDNPATFGPREFVRLEAFSADAQVFTLLRQRPVFDEVTLDLPLLAIVTNTDGTTNLDLFRERLNPPREEIGRDRVPREFLIKRLRVRVGTVRFINLTTKQPRTREMRLDFSYTFENVSNWKQLLVPELLRRAAITGGAFEGLVPEDLGETIGKWSRAGAGLFPEPRRRASETMKSLFEKLEETRKP